MDIQSKINNPRIQYTIRFLPPFFAFVHLNNKYESITVIWYILHSLIRILKAAWYSIKLYKKLSKLSSKLNWNCQWNCVVSIFSSKHFLLTVETFCRTDKRRYWLFTYGVYYTNRKKIGNHISWTPHWLLIFLYRKLLFWTTLPTCF